MGADPRPGVGGSEANGIWTTNEGSRDPKRGGEGTVRSDPGPVSMPRGIETSDTSDAQQTRGTTAHLPPRGR